MVLGLWHCCSVSVQLWGKHLDICLGVVCRLNEECDNLVAKQVPATHEQSLLYLLKLLHSKIPAFPLNLECYQGGRSICGYSCPYFFGDWASLSNILLISFSLGQTVTMSSLDPLWANGSYPRSPFLLEVVQLVCLGQGRATCSSFIALLWLPVSLENK